MRKSLFTVFSVMLICLSASLVMAYENSSVVGQVQDRVVITVKSGVKMALTKSSSGVAVGVSSLDKLSLDFQVKDMEQLYAGMVKNLKSKSNQDHFLRTWAVDFPAEMGLEKVKAAYEALPEVEEVRLVDICKMYDAYLPNDPSLTSGEQYYLRNLELGGADIHAVGGWNQVAADTNVIVCILDSGVDWHHPDLGGTHPDKVNGALWTNWTEYYGSAGIDDDGNGKVDDIRGWDFVNGVDTWPGGDGYTADNDPMDFGGHGTMCAGVAGAMTNNGVGIAGASGGCKIMAVRCGYLPDQSDQGLIRMDFAAQGIIYAINNGARIINCSWGSSPYLAGAVNTAIFNNVLIVTAAGNDNSSTAPYLGTRSSVMAVAATGEHDQRTSFSNYGSWIEVCAPGEGIFTTYYDRNTTSSTYTYTQGTSFSSPITAGAAGLILSRNPSMTLSRLIDLIEDGCDNIDALNPGYEGMLGHGRINLLKSLGDTRHCLPDEFPTVFDAINSAAIGDTIAVVGGEILSGSLSLANKNLHFKGGYSSDYLTRDPIGNPSILDGTPSAPVLKFSSGTNANTVVDGFIIRGGGGSSIGGIPDFARAAGGIDLSNTSPTLRNLVVTDNSVGDSSNLGYGGGILMYNSSSVLENVEIYGNTGIFGAGLYSYNSSPTLIDCNIHDNVSITTNSIKPLGGGVHFVDSTVEMQDCFVTNNLDAQFGGGIYARVHTGSASLTINGGEISGNSAIEGAYGLRMEDGELVINGTTFDSNVAGTGAALTTGGGLFVTGGTVAIDDATIKNTGSAIFGGGMNLTDCSNVEVSNSLFFGNVSGYQGGAMKIDNAGSCTISGNTIVANSASSGNGMSITGGNPTIDHNIVAFNVGSGSGLVFTSSTPTFSCNDVFDNAGGLYSGVTDPTGSNGNISVNPNFCQPATFDYTIISSSPCAPDNSGGCGLIGALPVSSTCSTPVPEIGEIVPSTFRVEQNFPNPFNPSTTIVFSLAEAGPTTVTVFDLAGRRVNQLLNDKMAADTHSIQWDGQDDRGHQVSAGVYFYMVSSGKNKHVGRMALVK